MTWPSNLTPEEFEIVWTAFLEAVAIHLPPSLRKKDNIRQFGKARDPEQGGRLTDLAGDQWAVQACS